MFNGYLSKHTNGVFFISASGFRLLPEEREKNHKSVTRQCEWWVRKILVNLTSMCEEFVKLCFVCDSCLISTSFNWRLTWMSGLVACVNLNHRSNPAVSYSVKLRWQRWIEIQEDSVLAQEPIHFNSGAVRWLLHFKKKKEKKTSDLFPWTFFFAVIPLLSKPRHHLVAIP